MDAAELREALERTPVVNTHFHLIPTADIRVIENAARNWLKLLEGEALVIVKESGEWPDWLRVAWKHSQDYAEFIEELESAALITTDGET